MKYPGKIRIIAGQLRGRIIPVLDQDTLRPTPDRIRETLFNWLQPKIVGARCLDCFSGTGILGFEALSRGAKNVTLLDSSRVITSALTQTMNALNIDNTQCQIINQDVAQWLSQQSILKTALPYDILFLDPPFDSDLLNICIQLLEKNKLLAADAWIYIETPAQLASVPVPIGWAPFKSKIAGKVGYHLLAHL